MTDGGNGQFIYFQPTMCYVKSYSLVREPRRPLVYHEVLLGSVGRERDDDWSEPGTRWEERKEVQAVE